MENEDKDLLREARMTNQFLYKILDELMTIRRLLKEAGDKK